MYRLLPVLVLTIACKPPPEAPEEVGELSRFLFSEFYGEDESLQSGAEGMRDYLLSVDLEAGLRDRELTIPSLRVIDVGDITLPDGFDPETQVSVAISGLSQHDLATAIEIVLEPNQVCIESDTTKYYTRTYTTDTACFGDGSCVELTSTNEVRKENFLANIWYDLDKEFRVVTLEDGTDVLLARSWISGDALTDNGNGSIEQSLTVEAWIPHPDDPTITMRYSAMWSSVDLSGVGDDLWANLVTSGLDEGFENSDTFIDGGDCDNERDREYDRE